MNNYLQQEDRSLVIDRTIIPPNDRLYARALIEVDEGTATIEAWTGSQREADYISAKVASDWKVSRTKSVSDITVTVDGMVFDGDEISQGRMARAVIASDSDSETTVWVLADNTPTMVTALQLKKALKLAGLAQTALWVRS